MNRRLSLFVAALCLAAACAQPAPPPPPPTTGSAAEEQAIRAMGPKYAELWNKSDVAGLVQRYADDYEGMPPTGTPLRGRGAVEAQLKDEATQRQGASLTLAVTTSYFRWMGPNAAVLGGPWTMTGLPPGAPGDKGSWTTTVARGADGQFRFTSGLVAQFVPPPAPAPGKGK